MAPAIRVLVCDDSAVMRIAIARALESDPAVRVVARAANGALAVEAVKREPVDVVVLDIDMPVMDGLAALPLLLRAAPGLRVVMASTLTTRGADVDPARAAAGRRRLRGQAERDRRAHRGSVPPRTARQGEGARRARPDARRQRSLSRPVVRRRLPPRACSPSAVRPAARRRCSR